MAAVEVLETSITTLPVDAITNAANTTLQNVGGVALVIVTAGGRDASGKSWIIQDECDKIMEGRQNKPLGLGEAVATGAGKMTSCRWVIHAATMVLGQPTTTETIIRDSTANTLQCADQLGAKSLGLVALGTGVAKFPKTEAADAMVDEVRKHLDQGSALERIVFAIHNDAEALKLFQAAVQKAFPNGAG